MRQSEIEDLAKCGYIIGRRIGEGSFSKVNAVSFTSPDGSKFELACKAVNRSKIPIDFKYKYSSRELHIATKVRHPHIIEIHSIVQRNPKIYIFMELANKGDLFTYINNTGPLEEKQAKTWFLQMAMAVNYLQSRDIAHRDLKCENIFISKDDTIKLGDFGFARYCRDENGRKIKSETYCGSTAYAAPEVLHNIPYDPKMADIWSLGVILFVMLNADMPFDVLNFSKFLDDQMKKNFKFTENVSSLAQVTVAMLLQPKPRERWNINKILDSEWLQVEMEEPKTWLITAKSLWNKISERAQNFF